MSGQPKLSSRLNGRNAYSRGYVTGGDNPFLPATHEHMAFDLGQLDRNAGRPAFPDAAHNPRRLARLWQQAQHGDLLAPIERQAVDTAARGSLL